MALSASGGAGNAVAILAAVKFSGAMYFLKLPTTVFLINATGMAVAAKMPNADAAIIGCGAKEIAA